MKQPEAEELHHFLEAFNSLILEWVFKTEVSVCECVCRMCICVQIKISFKMDKSPPVLFLLFSF